MKIAVGIKLPQRRAQRRRVIMMIVGDGNDHDFNHNLSVFLLCASALSCSVLYFQTASNCGFQINKFFGRYRGMIFQLIYAESNTVVRCVPARGRF